MTVRFLWILLLINFSYGSHGISITSPSHLDTHLDSMAVDHKPHAANLIEERPISSNFVDKTDLQEEIAPDRLAITTL